MELDDNNSDMLNIEDSQLIRNLPSKNDAISSGLIASFSFSDGKSTKALFDYMTIYSKFTIDFHVRGIQFTGILNDEKNNCLDTASYMIFKSEQLVEYIFCPENMNRSDQESVCLQIASYDINNCLKQNKATTVFRFEYNINNPRIAISVSNGPIQMPYFINFEIVESKICPVEGNIVKSSIGPNFKLTSELFSCANKIMAMKYNNILYDFNISIYSEGFHISTEAPGVGGMSYGKNDGNPISFPLKNCIAKRLAKLCKISPRSTVSLCAIDENVFKISFSICGYGEMVIFQFPKQRGFQGLVQKGKKSQSLKKKTNNLITNEANY